MTDTANSATPDTKLHAPKRSNERISKIEETVEKLQNDMATNFSNLLQLIEKAIAQKPEVRSYVQQPPNKEQQLRLHDRDEPWRMSLADFLDYKADIKPNWDVDGNARIAQRLSKELRRTSGHAEGQLYIDWCAKVGQAQVKAFWLGRGFEGIPEGL